MEKTVGGSTQDSRKKKSKTWEVNSFEQVPVLKFIITRLLFKYKSGIEIWSLNP